MKNLSVTWAFNPYSSNQKSVKQVIQFTRKLGIVHKLRPTFIVSPAEFNVTYELGTLNEKPIVIAVHKKMKQALAVAAKTKKILDPIVIFEKSLKLSDSGRHLVKQARKMRSNFILVQGQGHRMGALALGSFTQSLMFNTDLPTLVLPQKYKPQALSKLLFCTDFSDQSFAAFKQFCNLAKNLGAKIHLYHALRTPTLFIPDPLTISYAGLGAFNTENYLEVMREQTHTTSVRFLKFAKSQKIDCDFFYNETSNSVAEAILRFAKLSNAGMIGLAAEAGSFLGNLLGTSTLKVVLKSKVPVWVLKTK